MLGSCKFPVVLNEVLATPHDKIKTKPQQQACLLASSPKKTAQLSSPPKHMSVQGALISQRKPLCLLLTLTTQPVLCQVALFWGESGKAGETSDSLDI